MADEQIIVIDKIEEAEDKNGKTYLKITDKAGVTRNFKEGRSKLLTNKGHLLKEGKAIKVHFADYTNPEGKVFPFVKDFEVVEDVFVAQAAEKAQTQVKVDRNDSIEAQVAFKGMVELIMADRIDGSSKEYKATIEWAMARIDLPAVIIEKIEEAKSETNKDTSDNQETQTELTNRQDSGKATDEAPNTIGIFLTWLKQNGIKAPRTFLEVEYKVSDKEVLTLKKCQELYNQIKKDKGW